MKKSGFTLIESILYIAILGSVVYFIGNFALNSIFDKTKIESIQNINKEGRSVIDQISNKIKDSLEVSSVSGGEEGDSTPPALVVGNALGFAGSGGYASVPHNSAFDVLNEFSISFWVYPRVYDESDTPIISHGFEGGTPINWDVRIYHNSARLLWHPGGWKWATSGLDLYGLNEWTHIVITYNSGTGASTIYINGVSVAVDINPAPFVSSVTALTIGGDQAFGSPSTMLDEVLIFNKILSQSDVAQLYNSGSGLYCTTSTSPCDSGLVVGYHMDEGSGDTIADFSSGGNTGTINTATWETGKVAH